MMNIGWSLLVWAIVFTVVLLVSRKAYLTWWNAFIMATLFGFLFLLIFMPFGSVYDKTNPWIVLYLVIMVISPLILAIFIIRCTLKNKSSSNSLTKFKEPLNAPGTARETVNDLVRPLSLAESSTKLTL